jgi:hypothetical protein
MGRNNKDFNDGKPDSYSQYPQLAPGAKEKIIADTSSQLLNYFKPDYRDTTGSDNK